MDNETEHLADAALGVALYGKPDAGYWPLTGFLACTGTAYDGELLVVGRAVNTWAGLEFRPEDLRPRWQAEAFAQQVYDSVTEPYASDGVFDWVVGEDPSGSDYNAERSQFWRMARLVYLALTGRENVPDRWPEQLAWSNLYKLAPAAGATPSEHLIQLQIASCLRLFQLELLRLRPRHVILLTGLDWSQPFIHGLCEPPIGADAELVDAITTFRHPDGFITCLAVGPHPQHTARVYSEAAYAEALAAELLQQE